jgi:acetyl/propionyl-CoA carboxylase alpha subunit
VRYSGRAAGADVELEIDFDAWPEVRAVIDGKSLVVRLFEVAPGAYWFTLGGRSVDLSLVPDGDGYRVRVGGEVVEVVLAGRRARVRTEVGESGGRLEIRAPMPGRVVRVLAEAGAALVRDQAVVVLEAMKMQNEIRSPRAGVVVRIEVEEGTAVNAGELLLVVE